MAYVYALLLKNGLIKIGATGDPWSRANCIAHETRQRPIEMVSAELRDGVDMFDEERRMLSIASQIAEPYRGKEYFRDFSFATAVSVISKARATALVTRRFGQGNNGISLTNPERKGLIDGPICAHPEAWLCESRAMAPATPALAPAEAGEG
jgi:hypothetical protein